MKYCCDSMKRNVEHRCDVHTSAFDCLDALLYYSEVVDEYGIIYHDGGSSYQEIFYCPWCRAKLPLSKRKLWFETLEKLGYDSPMLDDTIPEEFNSDEWWKKRSL